MIVEVVAHVFVADPGGERAVSEIYRIAVDAAAFSKSVFPVERVALGGETVEGGRV